MISFFVCFFCISELFDWIWFFWFEFWFILIACRRDRSIDRELQLVFSIFKWWWRYVECDCLFVHLLDFTTKKIVCLCVWSKVAGGRRTMDTRIKYRRIVLKLLFFWVSICYSVYLFGVVVWPCWKPPCSMVFGLFVVVLFKIREKWI